MFADGISMRYVFLHTKKDQIMKSAEKQLKVKDNLKDMDNQRLERLHHKLFQHPDSEKWNAAGSLAQPSFLKQIDSHGGAHTTPVKVSPVE